jgi:hypothetical protein
MAWQTDMLILLRSFINDSVTPYTYDDSRLEEVVVAAAITIVNEIDFANTYTIDLENVSIDPDPVDSTEEMAFQVLVCRRAAILIFGGEYRTASDKAISFKDGPSQLDARGITDAKRRLLEDAQREYQAARVAYLTGEGMHGRGIVTPFNIGAITSIPGSAQTLGPPQRDMYGNWG